MVRGSEVLIAGEVHLAEHMHGSGGLGGVEIPSSDKEAVSENPFERIRDRVMGQEGKIVWANTGATTNLCWLFRKFPEVKSKISQIVLMGGAIGVGNITPAAEFNIYFDPESFKEVLQTKGDISLVMIPLELTHQVRA